MPEATEGPTVLRILLGTQLRRLRENRRISAQAAAKAIRGSESKISRIELGRNAIREIDVLDLLTLYGVGPVEREQLLTLAEQANRPGWWHRFNDILPDWFQSYVGMEEAATSIRVYEPQLVPGLLQIPTYTAAVLAVCDVPLGEAERHIILRKERQRRFTEGRLKLWAILEETALRRPVGSKEILRDQLHYLLSLCHRPNFTLQIIPFGVGGHAVPSGFTLLRFAEPDLPDVAYLEYLTSALYFDKKSEVDRYLLAMERLSIAAAKPSHTAGILTAVIAELEEELQRPPGQSGLCPRLADAPPGRGHAGDGRVELPVLGADEEALPLVPVEHLRGLAAILRVADRHASFRKVRYLHAASGAARAALEPAQAVEVGVHPPSPFG
jgi:transcriptional regulator with XRE-family HTH domain